MAEQCHKKTRAVSECECAAGYLLYIQHLLLFTLLFHLQLHRGFSGVFMVMCLEDSKCESGVLLVRHIQIKNCSGNTNLLGFKCCFYCF